MGTNLGRAGVSIDGPAEGVLDVVGLSSRLADVRAFVCCVMLLLVTC